MCKKLNGIIKMMSHLSFGKGKNIGRRADTKDRSVRVDKRYFRLRGRHSCRKPKAFKTDGNQNKFEELVDEMVEKT